MKRKIFLLNYLFSPKSIIFNLFLIGILFQVYLMTQAKFLYDLLKILFIVAIILLILSLIKLSTKKKVIILVIFFIVILRLPFYLYHAGLITTSDNALEALQCLEIQESKTTPFFLLEAIKHHGTIKYLLVAFLWDFFRSDYLFFVLIQLAIFMAVLFLIHEIFKQTIDKSTLLLFIFMNFVFIEVMFGYSLSYRGGTYLEMLLLFFLGVYLFDLKFINKMNILLSYYFIFLSIYLHPLGVPFAICFIFCIFLYSLKSHRIINNLVLLAGGFFIGGFHLLYYIFFKSKPILRGEWGKLEFISLSDISPGLLVNLIKNFKAIFWNVFNFETSYLINYFDEIKIKHILYYLNKTLIYFSLVIFIIGSILVVKKVARIILKKEELIIKEWPYIFFLALLFSFVFKVFVFRPVRIEPRHNIDLALLVILSYLFVFSSFLKGKRIISFKTIMTFFLLLLFTFPHYFYSLKMTHHKKNSYHEILSVLRENRVRYLTTDFIMAYTIYFLSKRRILVSDSLGPLTIRVFYPDLRRKVDKIPRNRKAFLFYSEDYPAREWHKHFTKIKKINILHYLKKEKINYKTYKLKDFILIIPSRGETGRK